MTYKELLEKIEAQSGVPKSSVDAVLDAVRTTLHEGATVALPGVGKFEVKTRPARKARNPRTGEAIAVPAKRVPGFRASSAYKKAVL